jgi:predicted glycosyltransferase
MRSLVDIGHPGHVHFYKHAIARWQQDGHDVLISARDKDVTLSLLDHYQLPYRTLSTIRKGQLGMLYEFLQREAALLKLIRSYDPHVITEIGGLFIAPVCWLLRKPSIVFTDSEPVPLDRFLTYPFATTIYTPHCFLRDIGSRHLRYNGYHELAYLHPDYFQPDPSVLDELGVAAGEPYIILRFVAWKASHDIAQHGFSPQFKMRAIRMLSQYGRVFITSEEPLPEELEPYRITISPHRIHDALYYATLFMGDGATMATEAAVLGTPAVRASSMALNMGNFQELMERYQLVYSYYDPEQALEKALSLLENNAKVEWQERRNTLLGETIDVTEMIANVIQNTEVTTNGNRYVPVYSRIQNSEN